MRNTCKTEPIKKKDEVYTWALAVKFARLCGFELKREFILFSKLTLIRKKYMRIKLNTLSLVGKICIKKHKKLNIVEAPIYLKF